MPRLSLPRSFVTSTALPKLVHGLSGCVGCLRHQSMSPASMFIGGLEAKLALERYGGKPRKPEAVHNSPVKYCGSGVPLRKPKLGGYFHAGFA